MYHPDKNKSPDATVKMAEINLAYETLCDSQKRIEYDIRNGIAVTENITEPIEQDDEEEELEQEPVQERSGGKCLRCNFVNNSGMFICSVCGYVFKPEAKSENKSEYSDNEDEIGYEDISYDNTETKPEEVEEDDALSEIIRCPRCDEINRYSRGTCWQCGLAFEIEEVI